MMFGLNMLASSSAHENEDGAVATPRAVHWLSSTPRMGTMAKNLGEASKEATSTSNLAYNTHSWCTTFRLLNFFVESSFVLGPWIVFSALSIGLAAVNHYAPHIAAELYIDTSPLGLGGVMGLLLAFRLNASYTRWSLARTYWGQVINGSRSLLTQMIASAASHQTLHKMSSEARHTAHALHEQVGGWLIAFAVALCCHLRQETLPRPPKGAFRRVAPNEGYSFKATLHDEASFNQREKSGRMLSGPLSRPRAGKGRFDALFTLLSRSQYAQLKESTHSPLYALTRLRHAVETALITPVSVPCTTAEDGGSTNARCKQYLIYPHPHMMSHSLFGVTEDILGALTGCERILRTPLPPGYVGVLRILMILFLTVLPFSLVESLRWGVVPIHMVLSYVILEVEETAVQIEQPFGFEYNDLPIDVYCLTVQADVLRLLDESRAQANRPRSEGDRSSSADDLGASTIPRWTQQEEMDVDDPEPEPEQRTCQGSVLSSIAVSSATALATAVPTTAAEQEQEQGSSAKAVLDSEPSARL